MAKTATKGKPKKPTVAKPKKENKNLGGAPPKYDNVDQLQAAIDKYFKYIEGEFSIETDEEGFAKKIWERYPEPATITGLAYWLGFDSRQSIYDYKGRAGFSYTIKRARLKIEANYEKNLSGQQPAGSIFALKNLGWNDKVQTELTGKNGGAIETKIQQITGIKVE